MEYFIKGETNLKENTSRIQRHCIFIVELGHKRLIKLKKNETKKDSQDQMIHHLRHGSARKE